jgi:hypothetical protein
MSLFTLHVPHCKTSTLQAIAQHVLARCYAKQKAPVLHMIRVIARAMLDMFERVCERLLPIPSKLDFVSRARNLVRVVNGTAMAPLRL